MKSGMKLKQLLFALIGNCVLGAGVAMGSQALLGTDPSVSFSQAASMHLGISIGQMITITNVVLLIIALIIKKENVGIATFIVVFLNQYPVDFVTNLIPYNPSLAINVLWVILGCVVVAIGCNIIINSNLGMGIYDALIFGIASRVNKKYSFVRYFVDGIFLLLTFILKGYIGIGTVIPYIITGKLIEYTKPYVDKLFKL